MVMVEERLVLDEILTRLGQNGRAAIMSSEARRNAETIRSLRPR